MANSSNIGGYQSHRPGCACRPCTSQRRKEEAIAVAAGVGGSDIPRPAPPARPKDVLEADPLPLVATEDKTPRARIAQFLAIRAQHPELKHADIARQMGLVPKSLYTLISRATREGWLIFQDPVERIENEIIPKVVDNLSFFLDAKDKQVTIETAKGTIFRKYAESQGISDVQQTVLALKIEQPEQGKPIQIAVGSIVGKPRQVEEE